MKRSLLRKCLTALLCLTALAPLAFSVAEATPPTPAEDAVTVYTPIPRGGTSLSLEETRLSFVIDELAERLSFSDGSETYGNSVEIMYGMSNPTGSPVTSAMMIPIGGLPQYAEVEGDSILPYDLDKYSVTVDGEVAQTTLRMVYSDRERFNDLIDRIDSPSSDGLFSSDTTVARYTYRLSDTQPLRGETLRARTVIPLDCLGESMLVIPFDFTYQDLGKNGTELNAYVTDGVEYSVYVIGKEVEGLSWILYGGEENDGFAAGSFDLISQQTMTLADMYDCAYDPSLGIPREDVHNAMNEYFCRAQVYGSYFYDFDPTVEIYSLADYFLELSVTVDAGETAELVASLPVYPGYSGASDPYTHFVDVDLTGRKLFASRGGISVSVDTPFYIVGGDLRGVDKIDTGYLYSADIYGFETLSFTLCETEKYKDSYGWLPTTIVILFAVLAFAVIAAVAIVVLLAVFIISRIRRRKGPKT